MREEIAAAVDEIIVDIRDRAGLGDEWDQIDDSVRDEIRAVWIQILEEQLHDGTE